MTIKPVMMIHEVDESLFELPLEDFTLTFDDGLYTQYQYLDRLRAIDTDKIFFISTNIICTGKQSTDFITCREAHGKAFAGNKENYMTLEQIKEIDSDPHCHIGGHSHNHINVRDRSLVERLEHIKLDTEMMLIWFEHNLGYHPTRFCFPYNEDLNGLYQGLLKRYGVKEFYGRERIPR